MAAQGSAVAQANLAWLVQRSTAYKPLDKAHMSLRLLHQAAESGMLDAWVDAGDIEYHNGKPGTP